MSETSNTQQRSPSLLRIAMEVRAKGALQCEMQALKPPLWAPLPGHRRYRTVRATVHGLIDEIIAARRAEPQSSWPDDLLSRMMSCAPALWNGHRMVTPIRILRTLCDSYAVISPRP